MEVFQTFLFQLKVIRTTRAQKFKFRTPRVGVDAAENSFVVKCSRFWNNLPEKLCLNSNIKSFNIALKEIYFAGYKQATYQ
jgi:hypothetical protein